MLYDNCWQVLTIARGNLNECVTWMFSKELLFIHLIVNRLLKIKYLFILDLFLLDVRKSTGLRPVFYVIKAVGFVMF